ncbi:carboxypeptidase regulatory-like domain-containing protein [candidate division WOR-3 bacterium]|nr:carboxypeptidase regulatory-like domain-containing protein [candidate division WOR-3 bacterium]
MFLILLVLSQYTSFHPHADFLSPDIGKRWRIGVNALSFYSQNEIDDSLDYFFSGGLLLEWKLSSFVKTSGGAFIENADEKEVSPLFYLTLGGPGGAFIDLGGNFSASDRHVSASVLADIQKNRVLGINSSIGYNWRDSSSFPFISSRFYFTKNFNKTYFEIEKQFHGGAPFFSYENTWAKLGVLADFFGNFSLEILTTVRLGANSPPGVPDWTLGAKIFSGLFRDQSSVRGSGSLAGNVRSQEGQPVANASIIMFSDFRDQISSDSSGYFQFSEIPSGFITIDVATEGFKSVSMPVSIRKNQNTYLEIMLEPSSKNVTYDLSTFDCLTGQPVFSRIRGFDNLFTDTLLTVDENETLFIESENRVTAVVVPQKNLVVKVPMISEQTPFIFEKTDFEDSSLSSSGMIKLMDLKYILEYYPEIILAFEGSADFSETVRNSLFAFFSLNNPTKFNQTQEDSILKIYLQTSGQR